MRTYIWNTARYSGNRNRLRLYSDICQNMYPAAPVQTVAARVIYIYHMPSPPHRFIFEAGEQGNGNGATGSSSSGKCSAINYAIIRRPGRHIQFMTNCINDASEAVPKDVGRTAVCPGHFHFVLSWLWRHFLVLHTFLDSPANWPSKHFHTKRPKKKLLSAYVCMYVYTM